MNHHVLPPLVWKTWEGLGDCIYIRPFVRILARGRELYLATPWPDLYEDLPVHFLEPSPTLRTQKKNVARHNGRTWADWPERPEILRIRISLRPSIPDALAFRLRMQREEIVYDLPDFGPSPVQSERPVAVIRPATVRREWANYARNPRPEYITQAATLLRDLDYCVVSVADTKGNQEWYDGHRPPADLRFDKGELSVRELVSLLRHASVAVGGMGFLLPMGISTRTPLVIIGGGNIAHNHPDRVTGPRMDASRARFILPDRPCHCTRMDHDCDKEISDFPTKFTQALESLT